MTGVTRHGNARAAVSTQTINAQFGVRLATTLHPWTSCVEGKLLFECCGQGFCVPEASCIRVGGELAATTRRLECALESR